jgi:cytoskeletal protein RodZ
LEAIEADDTKILPGDFFHRSFIRQYASALGLDEPATKQILDAVEPTPEIDPIPIMSLPQQIAEVEQRSKPLAQIPTRVAATLLIVVLAGCSGLYALWRRAQDAADPALHVAETVPAPVTPVQAPLPAQVPSQSQVPSQAQVPVQKPIAAVPEPSVAPAVTPATVNPVTISPGTISVDLAATERTWVSLSSEGRTVFSGVLDASQTKNFALTENAKLLTGNAAGLDVRMNGRSLGPLGLRGQVRVVLFSQDNFQILSPQKM